MNKTKKRYNILKKALKNNYINYNMGLITTKEYVEKTEIIENELITIECLSGNK